MRRVLYPNRYPLESDGDAQTFALAQRLEASSLLQMLESRLSQGWKAWLCSPQPSLADMAILPFVRQFVHTDAAWFAAQPLPLLQARLAGFQTSSLFSGDGESQALTAYQQCEVNGVKQRLAS